MDPVAASSALQLSAQHGFSALLVLVLLVGLWRLLERQDKQGETRDAAYLGALARLTEGLAANSKALDSVGDEVRELRQDFRDGGRAHVRNGGTG